MRLSRLHITGFKSFPDRAELGFDAGVTAIVGPNGCGKSNVVDAITWVLGEQSAKSLRGDRMEDVIFSGSDARKPTAAAEVRLKLTEVTQAAMAAAGTADLDDLLDAQPLVTRDVEIGRRLYRSGESEYLIDGQVCRLRDVHDLLMDSGLGVKAYAVIEQGKIGQILGSRPAERRVLIEEAAGVTKYKSRRRAAELKLEAARQNLTRIDDIIFEVEKQRGALRRQAARARRYRRLRDELRRWEQVHFARRFEALAAAIETADARLADAQARAAAASAHVAELEAALEGVRITLTEAEAAATASREQAHAREMEIGRHEQQVRFDQQQIEDLARQAAGFREELGDLEGRQAPARQALDARREAARVARVTLDEAAGRVTAREADYRRALVAVQAVELESDTTRAALMASSTTLGALRQARDHAAAVRDRVAAERERLDAEARDLESEAARAQAEAREAGSALTTTREALDLARTSRSRAEAALADQRAAREQLAAALAVCQRDLTARDARLRSLEELEASRATFGDAARFLLGEAGGPFRQHGPLADHLEVDRSFERAVDALLGDRLQYLLVEQAADVATALELLAGREAGRCGFLVLAETGAAAEASLAVPSGAVMLSAVARGTGVHAAAVTGAVGQAVIVQTAVEARALAARLPVPVATPAGEVFRGGGLVEGGARQVRGILERRAERLTLVDEVAGLMARAETLAADRAAADGAVAAAEQAVTRHAAEQHEHEKAVVGLEARAGRTADELVRVTRRLDLVATERRRAEEEERAAEARRDEALAAILLHEAGQREAEGRLDGVLANLQTEREQAEGRLRLVTEAHTEQAALVERAAALEAEVARLEDAARDLEGRLASRREAIGRTEQRRDELRESIRTTGRRLDEAIGELDRLKQVIRTHDEQVSGLRADFGRREHDLRAARHALDAVRSDVMRAEIARATATTDLGHLSAACLDAVGARLEEVVARVAEMETAGELAAPERRIAAVAAPDDEDETGAPGDPVPAEADEADPAAAESVDTAEGPDPEAIIADLKRRIERLGPVNMMAIDQFDELETRHTFLTTQRQDLLDSIAQTGEAIRRIDKTTRERFADAFESINRHFETTFTTLFGGGRAGLVLIDQEHDPESGVDIIAQPPGKRLQNVQLLSGGEKALTAMALMFAIFKHRPSPFCLLDEIDAPLDDANIGRFVEMLQGMQEHTQFILITHNRKTMEIADRLYGVTMEEPGVSRLISLQVN